MFFNCLLKLVVGYEKTHFILFVGVFSPSFISSKCLAFMASQSTGGHVHPSTSSFGFLFLFASGCCFSLIESPLTSAKAGKTRRLSLLAILRLMASQFSHVKVEKLFANVARKHEKKEAKKQTNEEINKVSK